MQTPTPSAAAITERLKTWIERLAQSLDPDYPSLVVPGGGGEIDEPAAAYERKPKPDFLMDDEKGWRP